MSILDNPNVDLLTYQGREIYLIGTAHISHESVLLVTEVVDVVSPDEIAVELCDSRLKSLKDPERWKNTNLSTIIRQGKSHILFAQLLLAAYQKKLGKHLQISPGAEMMQAVELAESRGLRCSLVDRDISITLKRTWASLGLWGMFKLILATMRSVLEKNPEIKKEEIERLKHADALQEVMREFSEALPQVRKALIDERDAYLTAKIRACQGPKTVAVVGAAHVPGIKLLLNLPIDLDKLDQIPPKKKWATIFAWSIPALFIGGMAYSFFFANSNTSLEIFKAWFWITAIAGGIGAAIVRAHPLTVLSAFVCAPFAALNPFVAAGWIAGLVEAMVRKPQVKDLESIMDDMGTMRGVLKNRVSRTLLIVASTNLCVMIGMAIAGVRAYHIATEAPQTTSTSTFQPIGHE